MRGFVLLVLLAVGSARAATVAHYRFADGPLGAPVYVLKDSSGNGHDGRVVGQELFEVTTDRPGFAEAGETALDLRGRLDYAVIPHHADFAPGGDWTIEFFIKPDFFHQDEGGVLNIAHPVWTEINANPAYTILKKENTGEATKFGCAWVFHYSPTTGKVIFSISYGADRGNQIIFHKDLRDGKWHHIAVTFAPSRENVLTGFVDGFGFSSENIGNVPFQWGTGPIMVGAWARQDATYSVDDQNFDGMLDEVRFSNAALEADSFAANLTPLYAAVDVEAFGTVEIAFAADVGKIYRIEQIDPATGAWVTLGYAVGEGGMKSFFKRQQFAAEPENFRVTTDSPAAEEVGFQVFNGVEIRFPTWDDQLYYIEACETLSCQDSEQTFILGDGGMYSHFERAQAGTKFYRVERY